MTDRELLEMAAKAIQYEGLRPGADQFPHFPIERKTEHGNWVTWNPLADDGDALRLAVKLNMSLHAALDSGRPPVSARALTGEYPDRRADCSEDHGEDPCAAMRRAIVRAAAEIGRNMKDSSDE